VRWKRGKPPEDLDPFFYVVVKDGSLSLSPYLSLSLGYRFSTAYFSTF
jgi:hypothetical protein